MDKSPEAFRTISEVAEALETPAHVLRFWESRFPQIRPVKRAGGRRYYRPSDVALLAGIKRLLHEEGLTIRGVQKILREHGIRHVSGLAESAEDMTPPATGAADRFARTEPDAAELVEDTAPPVTPRTEDPAEATAEAEKATAVALRAALDTPTGEDGAFPGTEVEVEAEAAMQFSLFDVAPVEANAAAAGAQADTARSEVPAEAQTEAPVADPVAAQAVGQPAGTGAPAAVAARVRRLAESAADHETPTATLAARLRALPRGGLAHRAGALAEIAARLKALRARMTPGHGA